MFALYKTITLPSQGRWTSSDQERVKTLKIPTLFGLLIVVYVLIILWSGWFTVGKGEQVGKFTMGAYSGSYSPGGPYFKLPWPFEDIERVEVQRIVEIPIGYEMKDGKSVDKPEESETLTGDQNTVLLDSTLQFQRSDAKLWLLTAEEPQRALKLLAQSALRSAAASRTFDQVLTTERTLAQTESEKRIRDSLTSLNLGASVVAHQIQDTQPPQPVRKAFADVTTAIEDKNKQIHQANGYRGERVQKAKGEATKLLEDATGYKNRRINEARGDADRFELVYAQYKNAPDLTKDRMRFEALEAILPGKYQIIDRSASHGAAPVLKFMDIGAAAYKKPESTPHK